MVVQVVGNRDEVARTYRSVRARTQQLCAPLEVEDYVIQCMDDASPPKWHLAHTTWFFETFLLAPFEPNFRPFHPRYGFLFNSYYQQVGDMHARPQRGWLSRPTVDEIYAYRKNIDERMLALLESADSEVQAEVRSRTELGLHHEQQHQELLLMDIKYNLSRNPLRPAYRSDLREAPAAEAPAQTWLERTGGDHVFGHDGSGFAYDNESPRHTAHVADFELCSRLVTNGEFLEFIEAGGYREPSLWLSDGWAQVQKAGWQAPLYWEKLDGAWHQFTLGGLRPVNQSEPVTHVSFYEANAYAFWRGVRLPTEHEWELVGRAQPIADRANFVESDYLHPTVAQSPADEPEQLFGDLWELTQSPYAPYPGYRPPAGALGEYNGKFMVNQLVLRGGSCATPRSHVRATYRNFFYPHTRWCFQGFRLARDPG